jgi:hypothetical protein
MMESNSLVAFNVNHSGAGGPEEQRKEWLQLLQKLEEGVKKKQVVKTFTSFGVRRSPSENCFFRPRSLISKYGTVAPQQNSHAPWLRHWQRGLPQLN